MCVHVHAHVHVHVHVHMLLFHGSTQHALVGEMLIGKMRCINRVLRRSMKMQILQALSHKTCTILRSFDADYIIVIMLIKTSTLFETLSFMHLSWKLKFA